MSELVLVETAPINLPGHEQFRYVLRHNPHDRVTPFVTHCKVEPADGDAHYLWGHYFERDELEAAIQDVADRFKTDAIGALA